MARRLRFALVVCFFWISAVSATAADWSPFVEGDIWDDSFWRGTQGKLFLPLSQTARSLTYLDLRYLEQDLDQSESRRLRGCVGLGTRQVIATDRVLGYWASLDQLPSWNGSTFRQFSGGLELLNEESGLRINGYLPEQAVAPVASAPVPVLTGDNLVLRTLRSGETTCSGGEVEYEHRLSCQEPADCDARDLFCGRAMTVESWIVAGVFRYNNTRKLAGADNSFHGQRLRAELRLFDLPVLGLDSQMIAGAYIQQDIRGQVTGGTLSLRIPLGHQDACECRCPLSGLGRRMVSPVIRNMNVVSRRAEDTDEPVKFAFTDRAVSRVVQIDGNTGNPIQAFSNAGQDSLVIINGQISNNGTYAFSNGQAAVGGGGCIDLYGCESGTRFTFTAPGAVGQLISTVGAGSTSPVMHLADDNTVSGLTIEGGRDGLLSSTGGNYHIMKNTITGAFRDAIRVDGSVTGFITDNKLTDSGESGLRVTGNLHADLIDNEFCLNTQHGLCVNGGSTGTISNNLFAENTLSGFAVDGDVTGPVFNNIARDNQTDGFYGGANFDGLFTNNQATGNVLRGYTFQHNNGTFSDNIASNNGQHGYQFVQNNGTFINNTAGNNTLFGYTSLTAGTPPVNTGTATGNTGSGNGSGANTFP